MIKVKPEHSLARICDRFHNVCEGSFLFEEIDPGRYAFTILVNGLLHSELSRVHHEMLNPDFEVAIQELFNDKVDHMSCKKADLEVRRLFQHPFFHECFQCFCGDVSAACELVRSANSSDKARWKPFFACFWHRILEQ